MAGNKKPRWKKIPKRIIKEHSYHDPPYNYDFWCVAHEGDYYPKYLKDEGGCHSYETDGLCNEYCHLCPTECPLCPEEWLPEHYENYEEVGDWEDYSWRENVANA